LEGWLVNPRELCSCFFFRPSEAEGLALCFFLFFLLVSVDSFFFYSDLLLSLVAGIGPAPVEFSR